MVAGVSCAAADAGMFALDITFLAFSDAIWPTLFFYVFEARIIIWKFAVKIGYLVVQICCIALFELVSGHTLRDRPAWPT